MLVALALVLLSIPVFARAVEGAARSTAGQPVDLLEVSDSCVAVGQHITATVSGTGFEQWLPPGKGNSLTVVWEFAGVGSDPAIVLPGSRLAPAGTFTMTFDVTGLSQGFGGFAPDGSVHGRFQPAPQSSNATVTVLIVQPPGEDSPSHTFFITMAAPICHDVAPPALSG